MAGHPAPPREHAADLRADRRWGHHAHLPGRGRRRPELGLAPSLAGPRAPRAGDDTRPGARVPGARGPGTGRDPGPGRGGALHRRVRRRPPLRRFGVRGGSYPARRKARRGDLRRIDPGRRRRSRRRRIGRPPRRRPRCDRTGQSGTPRGCAGAPAHALEGAVRPHGGRHPRRGRARRGRAGRVGGRDPDPADPGATTHLGRARQLPDGQRGPGRGRERAGGAGLGALHAR